jgi:hypothetical protein
MKNVTQFFVIFLATSVFLSSCGSGLSVTKRLHNKGYFVSYSKKHSTSSKKENLIHKDEALEIEKVKGTKALNNFTEITEAPSETSVSKKSVKEESVIDLKETNTIIDNRTGQPEFIKTKSNVKSIYPLIGKSHRGEGYSLLWVVIIILLVLWALGLIGGFGSTGLLHLLLVIALILLILWLLRVI